LARFSLPAGTAAGLGVLSSYFFALNVIDLDVRDARTVATTTLVLVGLYLILALESEGRRRSGAVGLLALALLAGYIAVLVFPFSRDFFLLAPPSLAIVLPAVSGALLAILGLAALDPRFIPTIGAERVADSTSD
jgi:cation-transporting P-type ATPase E